jgi:hypothetical protein
MANTKTRTQPGQFPRTDPRIPHPSWRQTITGGDQGAGRVINARDFWARLGI